MAETFLNPIIEKLIELLAEEVDSLKAVHNEVKSLKDELEIIQPFLKDAEAKSDRGQLSEATKVWMKQLRDEANRIEDVVDGYHHQMALDSQHRNGFSGSLHKAGNIFRALRLRLGVAAEVSSIKDSLLAIKERGRSYGLRPLESGSDCLGEAVPVVDPARLNSLFLDEDELVGIDSTLEEFTASLVDHGQSMRSTISILGEGGIGKTTIAKKVYNDVVANGNFDCHVWITVSQVYNIGKILNNMRNKICPPKEQRNLEVVVDTEEAIEILRRRFLMKRYVVVFDDVWGVDFWSVMKHALPSNDKGSRIIVTTRNTMVVDSFNETTFDIVRKLRAWPSEHAWELFRKNAFRCEFQGNCPRELEELSRKIMNKCQGLPLVIVAVAGLLSKKENNAREWQNVLDNLNHEFEENPQLTGVSKVLSFSYHDLPYHLKSCFMYFGVLPQDYAIHEDRLCTLWIADGFIEPKRDKTLKQVAEEYLNELICRHLVSFEIRYGISRWCRVHDLLREIILTKADELLFCQVVNEGKLRFKEKSRRLSIHGATEGVLKIVKDFKIRSVFLFNTRELTKFFVAKLIENFKLLRLLDLEDSSIDNLPSEIGNLFHLRFLNLRGTKVSVLPKSIGNLTNLQTLNINQTLVQELPIEIRKLRNLQYLLASRFDEQESDYSFHSYCGVMIREGIGCLVELESLNLVEPCVGRVDVVNELAKLRKLKTLGVGKLTAEMAKALGDSIEKMNHLENLYIYANNEDEILDLKCILSPPRFLSHLTLRCRLQQFPDWISKQNLRELSLRFSRLKDDPLKFIKGLPNLEFLCLYKAYNGEELHFEDGSFPKLKELRLRNLEGLKSMRIERGAMHLLEQFAIGPSPLMEELPCGVTHLMNLKSLNIRSTSRDFVARLQPNGGVDYWKIEHIRSVMFSYRHESYNLGSGGLLERLRERAR